MDDDDSIRRSSRRHPSDGGYDDDDDDDDDSDGTINYESANEDPDDIIESTNGLYINVNAPTTTTMSSTAPAVPSTSSPSVTSMSIEENKEDIVEEEDYQPMLSDALSKIVNTSKSDTTTSGWGSSWGGWLSAASSTMSSVTAQLASDIKEQVEHSIQHANDVVNSNNNSNDVNVGDDNMEDKHEENASRMPPSSDMDDDDGGINHGSGSGFFTSLLESGLGDVIDAVTDVGELKKRSETWVNRGLDALEGIGQATMSVITDDQHSQALKEKYRLYRLGQDGVGTLSELLRDAKDRASSTFNEVARNLADARDGSGRMFEHMGGSIGSGGTGSIGTVRSNAAARTALRPGSCPDTTFTVCFDGSGGLLQLESLERLSMTTTTTLYAVKGTLGPLQRTIVADHMKEYIDILDVDGTAVNSEEEESMAAIIDDLILLLGVTHKISLADVISMKTLAGREWLSDRSNEFSILSQGNETAWAQEVALLAGRVHAHGIYMLAILATCGIEQIRRIGESVLLARGTDTVNKTNESAAELATRARGFVVALTDEVTSIAAAHVDLINRVSNTAATLAEKSEIEEKREDCDDDLTASLVANSLIDISDDLYTEAGNAASYIGDALRLFAPMIEALVVDAAVCDQ